MSDVIQQAAAGNFPMIESVRRFWHRRRTVLYVTVLMYPAKNRLLRRELCSELNHFVPVGVERGWNAQITAAVIAAVYMTNMVRRDFDIVQRERFLEQMHNLPPKDLVGELEWMNGIKMDANWGEDLDPFIFRFNFINGMLAHWLVREKTIDIFVKSIFVTLTAQALAGVDVQTINETLDNLIVRIGTDASMPAVR